jgi:hypothetical protein
MMSVGSVAGLWAAPDRHHAKSPRRPGERSRVTVIRTAVLLLLSNEHYVCKRGPLRTSKLPHSRCCAQTVGNFDRGHFTNKVLWR